MDQVNHNGESGSDNNGESPGDAPVSNQDVMGGAGGHEEGGSNPNDNGSGHDLAPADRGVGLFDDGHGRQTMSGNDDGGDGGGAGGPTTIDGKWESQLHRTHLKLRLKLHNTPPYAVNIGYKFKVRPIRHS